MYHMIMMMTYWWCPQGPCVVRWNHGVGADESVCGYPGRRGQKRRFVFERVQTVDVDEAQHGGRVVAARGALGPPDAAFREVRRFRSTSKTGAYPAGG
jgi:hypothetical protein